MVLSTNQKENKMEAVEAAKVGTNEVTVWVGDENIGRYTPTIGQDPDYYDAYEWAMWQGDMGSYADLIATCIMEELGIEA
jgi:hypothetical protein